MVKSFLVAVLVSALLLTAAQSPSVHALHKAEFAQVKAGAIPAAASESIIPLRFDKSKKIGASIFGYLPDWEYATSKNYLRYDILTHIAAFDFAVDATGAMTLPAGWPWTDVINTAHQNGVKMVLCVTNFNGDQIHTIISNTTVGQTFFSKLNQYIQQYSFDGVNIDFEDLNTADRGTPINSFMSRLTAYLKSYYPAIEVSFAGPALTSSWNVSGLAASCDYIFIMGYAFWGSWSTTTGACAPLTGGNLNIFNTVTQQYATVVGTTPGKLILGVPYYGLKWKAVSAQPHAAVRKYVSSTRFRDDVLNAPMYGINWASDNQVPWYTYPADTGYYQIWYDNDSSLGLKYALAQSKNLKGVGMWALGYDGARPELWNELYRRFYAPSAVGEENNHGREAFEVTVYPNPANPSAVISLLGGSESEAAAAEIYSSLGRRIAVIPLSRSENSGRSAVWNGKDDSGNAMPGGVYFAVVKQGYVQAVRKIILLK